MPQKVFVKKHILVEQPIISNLTSIWFDDFFYSFFEIQLLSQPIKIFCTPIIGCFENH